MKTTEHTAGYGKVEAMNCEHLFFVGGGRICASCWRDGTESGDCRRNSSSSNQIPLRRSD